MSPTANNSALGFLICFAAGPMWAAPAPKVVSCRYLTEDKPTICIEYRDVKEGTLKQAEEDCQKRSENGAQWAMSACPEPGRVGLCQNPKGPAAAPALNSVQIYYLPGFNPEAARIICESGSKGKFKLP